MPGTIDLYRFFTKDKVSSMRLLLYVLLGLVLSGSFHPWLFSFDLLFVFGGILFASLLNDYFDFKLLGEKNTIGKLISQGKVSEKQVLLMIWIPCVIPLTLFYPMLKAGASPIAMGMLIVSFLLSLFYCAPPLRLKKRAFFGIITPPIGIFLLFLQAVMLVNLPNKIQLIICVFVLLFSWYLEFIHLADDAERQNEITKISGNSALETAKAIGIFSLIFSLLVLPLGLIACAPLIFWFTRLLTIWKIKPKDISRMRQSLWSGLYCIEEFAIYAIFAIWLQS